MTARDRIVLIVVGLAALVAGFWYLAISPKRKDASELSAQVAAAHQRLETAQVAAGNAQAARRAYASDYAVVARLGKAVPVDDDVPSLLYQLETTAHRDDVDFRSIKLNPAAAASSTADNNAAAVASAAGKSTTATTTTATATASAVSAALPPGAAVGAAGFPTMPFTFDFQGSYFNMQRFLGSLAALTSVKGDSIQVKGRLLTVDGFQLKAAPEGFPRVDATVSATAYLLPADEGLTAGASPTSPSAAAQTASTSASAPKATASMIGSDR